MSVLEDVTQFINTVIKEIKENANEDKEVVTYTADQVVKGFESVIDHIKHIGDEPKEDTKEN